MLKKFAVKNFKNFKDWFEFDFTDTKNYAFNEECVQDDIVTKGLIYGPNGCGKSNLGHAILDIKNHLTDNKIDDVYNNCLNAVSGSELAEFVYVLALGDTEIEYHYGKSQAGNIIYEKLYLNGNVKVDFDRRNSSNATVVLAGTENLNTDLADNENLSVLKYIWNNTVFKDGTEWRALQYLKLFSGRLSSIVTVNGRKELVGDFPQITKNFFKGENQLRMLEDFLNGAGVHCKLAIMEVNGEKRLALDYGLKMLDFSEVASSGTITLCHLFIWLLLLRRSDDYIESNQRLIFIDEFDAFYHHAVSKLIVKELKKMNAQVILTTHNTSIMSNDLLRPDCYFIMDEEKIKPMHSFTAKELRKAHNIEKMYKAGAFDA